MTERVGIPRNTNEEFAWTATQEYVPGEIVQVMGRFGVVEGEANIAVGEEVNVAFNRQVDVLKEDPNTAHTFEDPVNYDTALKRATAGASTFVPGRCSKESVAGELYVRVMLF